LRGNRDRDWQSWALEVRVRPGEKRHVGIPCMRNVHLKQLRKSDAWWPTPRDDPGLDPWSEEGQPDEAPPVGRSRACREDRLPVAVAVQHRMRCAQRPNEDRIGLRARDAGGGDGNGPAPLRQAQRHRQRYRSILGGGIHEFHVRREAGPQRPAKVPWQIDNDMVATHLDARERGSRITRPCPAKMPFSPSASTGLGAGSRSV